MKRFRKLKKFFLSLLVMIVLTGCQDTTNTESNTTKRSLADNREHSKEMVAVNMDAVAGEKVLGNVL